jgi:hypothetical protein
MKQLLRSRNRIKMYTVCDLIVYYKRIRIYSIYEEK